jgi:pimeloyl-ACP methyl ester carboxylesterase
MKRLPAVTILFLGVNACATSGGSAEEPATPLMAPEDPPPLAPAPLLEASPAPERSPSLEASSTLERPVSLDEPPAIRQLPGFRSEMVPAPGFSGQAYVMEAGPKDAPTVVLVHGLGESASRDFQSIVPALAAHYHVLTFDLPGFGRSTHAHDLYSPEAYATFIHALVSQRSRGAINLVGHSMGGAISLAYAARFPTGVERLFLIDAAGVLHRKAYVNFAIAAQLDNVLGILAEVGKAVATDAMERSLRAANPWLPTPLDPALLLQTDLLRANVLDTPTRIAALATILQDFGPAIARVEAPTFILWGGRDAVASLRTGKVLQARLPNAQLRVLDGVGHDPMAERPAAVIDFLVQGLATPAHPSRKKAPVAPVLPDRPLRCSGERGVRISGDYSDITLDGCAATLTDVRARKIHIRNSQVALDNTVVLSPDVAVDVQDSRVQMTACDLSGSTALQVDGGEVDLAGVNLRGGSSSVKVGRAARLIFSVSHVDSDIQRRFLHDMVEAKAGDEW